MLEKIFGCSLITKLCSIFLMEANFNAINKIIYGIRMLLNNVRKYKLMPEEVFSKRNRLADNRTLSKVLFYDIVRSCRRLAGIALLDADNCYDRIAHPMLSMVLQAIGVPANAVKLMLSTIQDMTFSSAQDTVTLRVTSVDMEMTRLITPKHKALCKGRVVDQHA